VKLEWAPRALADREAIFDYIEIKSPKSAVVTDERISATVRRLRLFPGLGRMGRVSGTRELVVDGAPFILAYRLDADAILVLRVLHSSRRWPGAIDD
jgi:toxin ParE1/3/4